MSHKGSFIALSAVVAATVAQPVFAQHTWNGSSSRYWDVAANWTPGTAPNNDNVTNTTGQLIEYRSGLASILSFLTNGEFDLTGGSLTINGLLTLNSGGSLVMNGGTLVNATIASTSLNQVSFGNTSNVWDNVTLQGDNPSLNVSFLSGGTTTGGALFVRNGLNYTGTLTVNTVAGSGLYFENGANLSHLTFQNGDANSYGNIGFGNFNNAPHTLTLNDTVAITGKYIQIGEVNGNGGGISTVINNANLSSNQGGIWYLYGDTIQNNAVIEAKSSSSTLNLSTNSANSLLDNNASGIIRADGIGTLLDMSNSNLTLNNNGQIRALNGGMVAIKNAIALGNLQASGTSVGTPSTINLSGIYATSLLANTTAINGGRITFSGILDNTGATFDPTTIIGTNGANGSFSFASGTIVNGTLLHADLLGFDSNSNVFDHVTSGNADPILNLFYTSGNTVTGGKLTIRNGLIYAGNLTVNASTGGLYFDNGATLEHLNFNGDGNYGNYTYHYSYLGFGDFHNAPRTLTLNDTVTITGNLLQIGEVNRDYTGASTVVNNTNLSSNQHGIWYLYGDTIQNNAVIEARNNSAFYVTANNGNSVVNNNTSGIIRADGSGTLLDLSNPNVTLSNSGQIRALNGGQVNIKNAIALGDLQASGTNNGNFSTISLSGTYTPDLFANTTVVNGGRIALSGTIDNTNATFDPANIVGTNGANGSFLLRGGTIKNGTVAHADLLGFDGGGIFDGVTLGGINPSLNLVGSLSIRNDLTYAGTLTVNTAGGVLYFDNGGIVDNLIFNNTGNYYSNLGFGNFNGAPRTLTLNSNVAVTGDFIQIGEVGNSGVSTIVNNTSLTNNQGGTWYLFGDTILNNGILGIEATGKDPIDGRHNLFYLGTNSPGSLLINNPSGIIRADGNNGLMDITSFTLNNTGQIRALNGATVAIANATALGDIQSSGNYLGQPATVNLIATYATSLLANATVINGGRIALYGGTLDNTGASFDPSNIVGATGGNGSFLISGGTIKNGTIFHSGLISFDNSASNTFDNVTLDGTDPTLNISYRDRGTLTGGTLYIRNRLNYTGTLMVNTVGGSSLYFDNGATLDHLKFTSNSNYIAALGIGDFNNAPRTLTLNDTVSINGKTINVGTTGSGANPSTLVNNTNLSSNQGGYWSLYGDTILNNGVIEARYAGIGGNYGDRLALNGSTINTSGGILQSIGTNSALYLDSGNAATPALLNQGTFLIGVGAAASIGVGGFAQTATGTTTIDGTLYFGNFAIGPQDTTIAAGIVKGSGTITNTGKTLTNNGATFSAGDTLGKLTLNGNYAQTALGKLLLEIGGTGQGTTYDFFQVNGNINLGGELDILFVNGYMPTADTTFDFLQYTPGGRTGTFTNVVYQNGNNGVPFNLLYNDTTGFVSLSSAAVPESSTWVLVAFGGLFLGLSKKSKGKYPNID